MGRASVVIVVVWLVGLLFSWLVFHLVLSFFSVTALQSLAVVLAWWLIAYVILTVNKRVKKT
jgi:hypothetical protein